MASKKTKLIKGQQTLNFNEPQVTVVSDSASAAKVARKFQTKWLTLHPWLRYEGELMFCQICKDGGKINSFTSGATNFKTSSLTDHIANAKERAIYKLS
jgi:hypothetical protein